MSDCNPWNMSLLYFLMYKCLVPKNLLEIRYNELTIFFFFSIKFMLIHMQIHISLQYINVNQYNFMLKVN